MANNSVEFSADTLNKLKAGQVIAYPTESVYGLGCDPFNETAVRQVLDIKNRPIEKGMILIASKIEQVEKLIDTRFLTPKILSSWQENPITWVIPASDQAPQWITGKHDTLAIRLSQHTTVVKICNEFNSALVSTSANPAGLEPARTCQQVHAYFPEMDCIQGKLGRLNQPTEIWHAETGKQLR